MLIGRPTESGAASATRKTYWPSEGVGHAFLLLELLCSVGQAEVRGVVCSAIPNAFQEETTCGIVAAELYWKRLGAEKER